MKQSKIAFSLPLIVALALLDSSCAAHPIGSATTADNQNAEAASLTNFKVTFNNADYYSLLSPQYLANCAGDAKNYYDALALGSSGTPLLFPISEYDATTTIKPSFVKDVSVDLTYTNSTGSGNNASACSYGSSADAPTPTNCASFDYLAVTPPGLEGYGSGYYQMLNYYCSGQGPIASGPDTSYLSGGVYFDIDRTQLGTNENLLLHLTSIPLNYASTPPASIPSFSASDNALFNIHLISTGLTASALEQSLQPRFLTYSSETAYPQVAKKISTLAPATGQIREEQILIPLAADPTIDRIRVEKYSGSAILVSAALYRMGAR